MERRVKDLPSWFGNSKAIKVRIFISLSPTGNRTRIHKHLTSKQGNEFDQYKNETKK
jgi:hypothetical protein